MKRWTLLFVVLSLLGVSTPATSQVTFLIHKTGCLALNPLAPTHFSVTATGGTATATDWHTLLDRVVIPPQKMTLQLKPGYYLMSISSPRCWRSHQMFVVGSEWNRTVIVEPGITLAPQSKNLEEVAVVDYIASSGFVLHTGPSISKVRVKYEDGTDALRHNGNVWYLDYAPVGPAQIRLYAGRRLILTDDVVLQHDGFLEKSYAQH